MRVLLTGATGFVGSQVARVLLDARCEVSALVRPGACRDRIAEVEDRLSVIEGDLASLADPVRLGDLALDACIHLAWYAEPGRYLHAVPQNTASLRASLDLVEALASAGCRRLVATGTCAEYGRPTAGVPLPESTPIRPGTPYARAKTAFQLAAQDVAAEAGMGFAWARLFFLYGPREQPERIVPSAIRACLRHQPFPATAGGQVRDYLHVADAASALWAVAASDLEGPVNVCSAEGVTLREVLESVEVATASPGTIGFGEVPYGAAEWMWMVGDNARLSATGWRQNLALDAGVADAVAWWGPRL